MLRALPHVMARVFGPPLLIAPTKLDQMLRGFHAALFHRGSPRAAASTSRLPRPGSARRRRRAAQRSVADGYWIQRGVATVPVRDVLVRRAGQVSADSTEFQSYERLTGTLRTARIDPRVAAILLDIDSPGGEAGGVFDLAAEIRGIAQAKPVWAVANDDALSAAYLLASAAERVWATQTASLGSIGVVALHADQSAFDAAEGLKYTYIYRGDHKVDANPHEALSEQARTAIQTEIDRLYTKLVDMVATHRRIEASRVRGTQAQVYYGEDTIARGLVDTIGTFDEAHAGLVAHIKARGAITMDTPATVAAQTTENANVVQLRVDEARAAMRAEAQEIAALCALAKHPELAAGFIGEGLTKSVVITKLQEVQAADAAKAAIVAVDTTAAAERVSPRELARQAGDDRLARMYPSRR